MRRTPQPLQNEFQNYLRLLLRHDTTLRTSHSLPSVCCLHAGVRTGRRHRSTCLPNRSRSRVSQLGERHSICCSSRQQTRTLATVLEREDYGPLKEYDERVHSRKLREDEHQRSTSPCAANLGRANTLQPSLRTYKIFTKP